MAKPTLLLTLCVAPILAQPVISEGGVRNAASYAGPGRLNSGLAQGSLIVIFGRGMGPSALEQSSYPLPMELAGTSVRISARGITLDAPMVYSSGNQLAAIVPSRTPVGPAQLTVRFAGQTSAPVNVEIVQRNFGIFTAGQTGAGPAVIQNFDSQTQQPLNTILQPARPGQVVTLWGTGLGPVTGTEAEVPQPGDMDIPLQVRVGLRNARVIYKGRSGCCAGVDQVIFEIPREIEGCYVPVTVVAGTPVWQSTGIPTEGTASNSATLAIAGSGRCQDATGLTARELDLLSGGSAFRTGVIEVDVNPASNGSSIRARFETLATPALLRSVGILGLPPAGTCLEIDGADPSAPLAAPIDPGNLMLTGPRVAAITRSSPGLYRLDLPQALAGGNYTIDNGSGTSDVGAFRVSFTLAPPLQWINKSVALGLDGHTFEWTGGDPDGLVVLQRRSTNSGAAFTSICVERASAGRFTLTTPEWQAGLLEGGAWGTRTNSVTLSSIGQPARFLAPGLDVAIITTRTTDGRTY